MISRNNAPINALFSVVPCLATVMRETRCDCPENCEQTSFEINHVLSTWPTTASLVSCNIFIYTYIVTLQFAIIYIFQLIVTYIWLEKQG